jgi:urea transport system permease protein
LWVAVGGRGTLVGAALGAVLVNYLKSTFTTGVLAPYWYFLMGSLFILVTIYLPKGILGTLSDYFAKAEPAKPDAPPNAAQQGAA